MKQFKKNFRGLRRWLPLVGAVLMLSSILSLVIFWVKGGAADDAVQPAAPSADGAMVATKPRRPVKQWRAPAEPSSEPAPGMVNDEVEADEEDEDLTPSERAVARWESLVDASMDLTDRPAVAKAEAFKKAFDAMELEDQIDNIDYALNLLPDEQFPVLYLILFDKRQDPDILDAIFSDALNRDEVVKIPLMKELRKDKEHPMFFESARILDVFDE